MTKNPWIGVARRRMVELAACGVDKYVTEIYVPHRCRTQRLEPLRGEHQCRHLDPITKENLGRKMDSLGGSAVHTARADSGSGWHACAWRHATVVLYDQKVKSAFKGALQVALALDPGSYSGESTSVGAIYSVDLGKAAVLPIKASK